MLVSEKIENWSAKSIDEVNLVRNTYSTYRTKKFRIEKITPPHVHYLGDHSWLGSKLSQLAVSW
jgi:hypothetical protein